MDDRFKKQDSLSDRVNQMFNIPKADSSTAGMTEPFESVAANQNRLRKLAKEEEEREKGKLVIPPFLSEEEAQVFSREYFMESGLRENDNLFHLLCDLKIMQKVIKATIYSVHNQTTKLPLNETTIQSIFEQSYIPFHEDAAYSLLQKIGAVQAQIHATDLKKELTKLLNGLEVTVRNKIQKEIRAQEVTYPKIASELAAERAGSFRAYISNLLTFIAENSVLQDGYAVCISPNHRAHDYAADSLINLVDNFLCAELGISPARPSCA